MPAKSSKAKSKKVAPHVMDEDYLRKNLHDLSPDFELNTEQVACVLQRSVGMLIEDRKAGRPPPFYRQHGTGPYRYVLSDVKAVKGKRFSNTSEADEFAEMKILGFRTFGGFLNNASLNDEWPFAIVAGKPIDLFTSIEEGIPDESPCRWMTLGEYLDARKAWAETQPRQTQATKLTPGTKAEQPRKPIVLGKDTM